MNVLFTVLSFTYRERVRTRSFLVSTILMVVLAGLVGVAPGLIAAVTSSHTSVPPEIAVVQGQTPALRLTLAQLETRIDPAASFRLAPASDLSSLLHQVADPNARLQTVVIISQRTSTDVPRVRYVSRENNPAGVLGVAAYEQQAYTKALLVRLGLDSAERALLTATVPISGRVVAEAIRTPVIHTNRFVPIYVLELLLYMWVLLYGNIVAVSVAAEKGSRVQELLIAHASPLHLMWGKLSGVALALLTQFTLILLGGFIGVQIATASGLHGADLFAGITPGLLALFTLMFVLGYFLYASFFAAVGSVVSRVEDAGQAVLPVTMLLVLEFVFGIITLLQPTSTLTEILSFIPPFTPTVLLARVGMVGTPLWQEALAIGLLFVGVILAGWLCSRIYRVGVTLYGKRPSLRDLTRLLRAH